MKMPSHPFSPVRTALGGVATFAFAFATAHAAETRTVVAEATMVIGVARLAGADGSQHAVAKGAAVRVGDRIETDAGGHVHLRFVDGARVSVRPSSRLAIEDYSRSTAGAAGAIKFRLEEGVVRSITGEWGDASRESFRLNTPLAAIGIRGTDFVASAEAARTAASVFTGAIVFAPLDAQCAATVGPCLNGREAFLTQEMRGQVVQVDRNQARPTVVSAETALPRGGRSVAMVAARAHAAADITVAGATEGDGADKSLVNASRASDTLVAAANTPPRVEQLAWGRWSWAKPIEGDQLASAIDAAFREGRQGLVSDGAYSLFRTSTSAEARLATQASSADFRLAGGSAHVISKDGTGTSPATVAGGSLNVDFARSTFATQLQVTGATIGNQDVSASGSVLGNGVFISTSGNAYIAGGLSVDGREAGYFFDKAIDAGLLRGITLWGP